MVEPLPAPLARVLGAEMGAVVADLHRDHGVDLRLGVGVDGHRGRRRRASSGSACPTAPWSRPTSWSSASA